MPDANQPLWEQQAYDTPASWKAFQIYLTLPRRSLQKAADKYYGKTSANKRQLEAWSADKFWQKRVTAYEDHQAELARQEYEADRLEARVKRRQVIAALHGLLNRTMATHQNELDPGKINQLASAAVKILDQSRAEFNDLPTNKQDITSNGDQLAAPTVFLPAVAPVPTHD